jgi:hypothetical protein
MNLSLRVILATVLAVGLLGGGLTAAAAPAAPTPLGPANGAQVTVPFTISWAAVNDPSGVVAYNWQVSPSSTFSPVIMQDSTSGQTQATISGLANGTYFWRVQAVNGAFEQGAWSQTRSFKVSGVNAAEPGTTTLKIALAGTTQFHPFESIPFSWTSVAGAASYVFEADKNSSFPVGSRIHFDNIFETRTSIVIGDFCGGCEQGNYFARVYAVDANGNRGVPSASVSFGVFYNAPLPPPPTPLSPANGAAVTLPITLDWSDVPNPQPSGYDLQISRNSSFTDIEDLASQLNESNRTVLSLTPGTKFWRVHSVQGNASPDTAAVTAWSSVRSFTVSSAPPTVASVTLTRQEPYSGDAENGQLQLSSAAPSGGAVVSLTSTDPRAVPVPSSVTVPAGFAFAQFQFQYGQVTAQTPVTVTASLGSSSAQFTLTVQPPSLRSLSLSPNSVTGGADASGFVSLNGLAPPAGAVVSLTSDAPDVTVPATMTVPADFSGAPFTMHTSAVSAKTSATITANWEGAVSQALLTLTPQVPPASLTVDPVATTATNGASGRVALASTSATDVQILLQSSNPAVASVPSSVTVPAFAAAAGFSIATSAVAAPTAVTISASGGGVTRTATLTVNPVPAGPLPAPQQLAPASGARFSPGQQVKFDWSDVSGAASYTIQISTSSTFSSTVVTQTVTASQFVTSSLPKADFFWRVRANDPSSNPGAWSTSRGFRVN